MNQAREKKSTGIRAAHLAASVIFVLILTLIGCSGNNVTPREGSINGKIVDKNGTPVEDACVMWDYDRTKSSYTDEDGSYLIEGISFGDQQFVVEAAGFRTTSFSAAVYSGQTTTAISVSIEAKSFDFREIEIKEVSATHAVISWKTTDYTNGLIEYGDIEDTLGATVRETNKVYATTHSLKITGLASAKQYFFRIIANREGRSSETSETGSFNTLSTLEDKTPPAPPTDVAASLSTTQGQLTVFWAPVYDPDLKGYKVYRSETANGNFAVISNTLIARGQERYTDVSVIPGKKYYYRVTSTDQAGNESGFNNVAGILLPGNVTTEVRWTRANSPYLLSADLNILETGKLIIDQGVEVMISESDAFQLGVISLVEINVNGGAIVVSAADGLPVSFASNMINPAKGSWQGLTFENTDNPSNILANIVVSDATNGIHIKDSSGAFSELSIINCTTAVKCENTTNQTIALVTARRCTFGMEIRGNELLQIKDSSFVHPQICINSQSNDGLKISGCNFLEYTDTGLVSNESSGVIEFSNNLFVSSLGLGIKIISQSPLVEYNTFDTPYVVQLSKGNATIRKNIIVADRSVFGAGKKGIEHLAGTLPLPVFGPNNIQGFASETAHIGCTASSGNTAEDVLLEKELTGATYDYRLRQLYPNTEDPWGISREKIPFED
ncbi:MAG: hypothetical protein EOM80_07965 [Erysipelotrichia bacterium]|nr:hypothetical protein [Erysipelotrichia bacterium]